MMTRSAIASSLHLLKPSWAAMAGDECTSAGLCPLPIKDDFAVSERNITEDAQPERRVCFRQALELKCQTRNRVFDYLLLYRPFLPIWLQHDRFSLSVVVIHLLSCQTISTAISSISIFDFAFPDWRN